jgi:hypothetical protein
MLLTVVRVAKILDVLEQTVRLLERQESRPSFGPLAVSVYSIPRMWNGRAGAFKGKSGENGKEGELLYCSPLRTSQMMPARVGRNKRNAEFYAPRNRCAASTSACFGRTAGTGQAERPGKLSRGEPD